MKRHKSDPEQFDSLSNMISRHYIDLIRSDGKINKLIPDKQPEGVGALIPHDYKGKVLRLWRFTLKPNYDDVIKNGS